MAATTKRRNKQPPDEQPASGSPAEGDASASSGSEGTGSDTNGDGIIDFIPGKVVVPPQPTAAQNAAAADIAARLGYATTGLTPHTAPSGLRMASLNSFLPWMGSSARSSNSPRSRKCSWSG